MCSRGFAAGAGPDQSRPSRVNKVRSALERAPFPPKVVVTRAVKIEHGVDLPESEFSGGTHPGQANAVLEALKFVIVPKKAGAVQCHLSCSVIVAANRWRRLGKLLRGPVAERRVRSRPIVVLLPLRDLLPGVGQIAEPVLVPAKLPPISPALRLFCTSLERG